MVELQSKAMITPVKVREQAGFSVAHYTSCTTVVLQNLRLRHCKRSGAVNSALSYHVKILNFRGLSHVAVKVHVRTVYSSLRHLTSCTLASVFEFPSLQYKLHSFLAILCCNSILLYASKKTN